MNYIRVGLSVSVFLACCTYVKTYVLTQSGSTGIHRQHNDIENRILFLAKFLENFGSVTDTDDSPTDVTSQTGKDNFSIDKDYKDVEEMLRIFASTNEQDINVDKKDYAILPPASEWCRMMGFRRCRGSST